MRTIKNRIIMPLLAVLFATSLAFGVTSTFAQAEPASPAPLACPNNNDDLLGDCDGFPEVCAFRCQQRGYITGDCIGDASGDCCVCQR